MTKDKSMQREKYDDRTPKGRLSEETMQYYKSALATLHEEFDDTEMQEIFLNNTFSQLCEEAVKVSQNQTISSVVEKFIQRALPRHIKMFCDAILNDWKIMCTDKFASHVMQTTVLMIGKTLYCNTDGDKVEESKVFQKTVKELAYYFKRKLGFFMQDTYASHVLRVLLQVLAGFTLEANVNKSKTSQSFSKGKAHAGSSVEFQSAKKKKSLIAVLSEIADQVIAFQKLQDHVTHPASGPVMSTLLLTLHHTLPDKCSELCQVLIDNCLPQSVRVTPQDDTDDFIAIAIDSNESTELKGVLCNAVGTRVLEYLLCVLNDEQYEQLFTNILEPVLLQMSQDRLANFVLQKVLSTLRNEEQLSRVFKQLKKHILDIIQCQHYGVIVKMAEACQVYKKMQKKCVKYLQKAFKCHKTDAECNLVRVILSMTVQKDDSKVVLEHIHFHGSLLMQQLVQFNYLQPVLTSLASLNQPELKVLACNSSGSFVVDAIFQSKSIGRKWKSSLISNLMPIMCSLACCKNGSRALESIYKASPVKDRKNIAAELCKHQERLLMDQFGHFIWRNFGLQLFRQRPDDWLEVQAIVYKTGCRTEDAAQQLIDRKRAAGPNSHNYYSEALAGPALKKAKPSNDTLDKKAKSNHDVAPKVNKSTKQAEQKQDKWQRKKQMKRFNKL